MTEKKPVSFTDRLVQFLKSSIGAPVRLAVAGFHKIRGLFVTPKSLSQLRAEEKARQATIRRELRGLTTEHPSAQARPQPS